MAACSLALSLYNFTAYSESVKKSELGALLSRSAEELSKDSEKRLRAIEAEWDDMYSKFSRLAGRMDRAKAIEPPPPARAQEPPRELTRSDLIRRSKSR